MFTFLSSSYILSFFCYPCHSGSEYLVIWGSSRKQIKASWVSLCKFWSGSLGKNSQCGLLSVEHIEQGCSSPDLSWVPCGHLLTPWFLGRVKMFPVQCMVKLLCVFGVAAA